MNSAPDSYSGKFCKGEERVRCFVVSCRDASKGFLGPTDEALDLVALATKVAVEGDRDLPVNACRSSRRFTPRTPVGRIRWINRYSEFRDIIARHFSLQTVRLVRNEPQDIEKENHSISALTSQEFSSNSPNSNDIIAQRL